MDANTISGAHVNSADALQADQKGSYPDRSPTILALFARRLAQMPNRPMFFETAFSGREARATPHTWSEIAVRAQRAAAVLARAGVGSGDRVLLCLSDPARFLSFLFGAQALGAVPVPLPGLGEFKDQSAFRERIDAVIGDCEPRAIAVDSNREVQQLDPSVLSKATAVDASTTDLPTGEATSVPSSFHFDRSPSETAWLQYTSGSTGLPKGVVVTHANLMANVYAIALAANLGPDDRSFNWLPLFHDMGLIGGVMVGLCIGAEVYVMPTSTFVGRPDSWLRAMSQLKATFACGPNFAYTILARRLPDRALEGLDLSHWRLAFNGAEPIDRSSLEDFRRRFAASGFAIGAMFPVYGLAECTLAAAFPRPGAEPRYHFVDRGVLSLERRAVDVESNSDSALSMVSVGRALPEHRIRIVDPEGDADLPERRVGEVVVAGPSVTPFYFRKDGRYAPPRRELRTGDLGYMLDGELYIVDRLKDLLIVAGRNIVPSDVERVVAKVQGTRYGSIVAFAIRGSEGTDELYLVVGAEPQARHDERIRDEIRASVFSHFGVMPRELVLVAPKAIPKTSSGKVRRAMCRELYEGGAFAATASADDELPPQTPQTRP